MTITSQDFHQIKKLSLFCHYILLHCINEFHPSNALIYQCQYFGDLSLIETLSPCNTFKYHEILYNAMQYYAIQYNAMQYYAMQCNANTRWFFSTLASQSDSRAASPPRKSWSGPRGEL